MKGVKIASGVLLVLIVIVAGYSGLSHWLKVSPQSAQVSMSTAVMPPFSPAYYAPQLTSCTSVMIKWVPTLDRDGNPVDLYLIYRGGTLIDTSPAGTTSYEDTGLTPNTTYSYTLADTDHDGHSSLQSTSMTVETGQCPPTPPATPQPPVTPPSTPTPPTPPPVTSPVPVTPPPVTPQPPVTPPTPTPPPSLSVPDSALAKQILVVYNADFSDSVNVKNYYLSNRPGMSGAYTLGIAGLDGNPERITQDQFTSLIENPIQQFLSANSGVQIKYIVMMYDLPTRTYDPAKDPGNSDPNYPPATDGSVAGQLYGQLNKEVTYMDMGSVGETEGYIDKLASTYNKMKDPDMIISAEDAGVGGTTFYLDDVNRIAPAWTPGADAYSSLYASTPKAALIYPQGAHQFSLSNILGFLVWGGNTQLANGQPDLSNDYMSNPAKFQFSGNSSWYLIQTIESWNGRRSSSYLANFTQWFAENAFGGSNYSATPAGAVVYVDEPTNFGVNSSNYFSLWNSGSIFADAAWQSAQTPYSITAYPVMNAIGDPLIKR